MNCICNRLWCRSNFCWGNLSRICDYISCYSIKIDATVVYIAILFSSLNQVWNVTSFKVKFKRWRKVLHYICICKKQSKGQRYYWFPVISLRGLIETSTYNSDNIWIPPWKNRSGCWGKKRKTNLDNVFYVYITVTYKVINSEWNNFFIHTQFKDLSFCQIFRSASIHLHHCT